MTTRRTLQLIALLSLAGLLLAVTTGRGAPEAAGLSTAATMFGRPTCGYNALLYLALGLLALVGLRGLLSPRRSPMPEPPGDGA